MTTNPPGTGTASRVADSLRGRVPEPWEVYGERSRRYEIHLNGPRVELVRGPILLEGCGVRLLRRRAPVLGVGFQATTDLSENGLRDAVARAEVVARHAEFPAPRAELPGAGVGGTAPEILDPQLAGDPAEALARHVDALVAAFEPERDVELSFGSVKATVTDTSIANSSGLVGSYAHTVVETEVAVKASGGAEGRPPGEYWVTEATRRLDTDRLPSRVRDWARFARDARTARNPPNGEMPVVLPPEVLAEVLPTAFSFRFGGVAKLWGLAPEVGTELAGPELEVSDDGRVPWALQSRPIDDEGVAPQRRSLISAGRASEFLYDTLFASALGAASTGNAVRRGELGTQSWRRFCLLPAPSATTIVVPEGNGGTDEELVETAGEGLWVQQIAMGQPDPVTGAFGGEIRIGYRIRDGRLAEPVRGGTVGGRVISTPGQPSLVKDLSSAGSRAQLSGGVLSPTLLVGRLTVSGEAAAGGAA
jgi:TldD protein